MSKFGIGVGEAFPLGDGPLGDGPLDDGPQGRDGECHARKRDKRAFKERLRAWKEEMRAHRHHHHHGFHHRHDFHDGFDSDDLRHDHARMRMAMMAMLFALRHHRRRHADGMEG